MAKIPRKPQSAPIPIGGQISIQQATKPGRAAALIGQVLQDAGKARAGDGQALIRQGQQFFKLMKPALDNVDYSVNLAEASAEFKMGLDARMGQVTDDQGSPTFMNLVQDTKNMGEDILNKHIESITSPEAKQKFRNQFAKFSLNQQVIAGREARTQGLGFAKEGLTGSLTALAQQAGVGEEEDMLFFQNQSNDIIDEAVSSGAITPEDRFVLQEKFRKQVSIARLRHEIEEDPEAAFDRIRTTSADGLGLRAHERHTILGEAQRGANRVVSTRQAANKEQSRILKTQLKEVENIIDLGGAPPRDALQQLGEEVQGTEFEGKYNTLMVKQRVMSEFNHMSPKARTQLLRGLNTNKQDRGAASLKFTNKLERINKTINSKMNDDLFGLAIEQGFVVDVQPLNVDGDIAQQLSSRLLHMSMMEQKYGKSSIPLSKEEMDAFTEKYRTGNYQARSAMLGDVVKGLGGRSGIFFEAMSKGGSTQLAMAGELIKEGRASTAITLLKGQDILKDDKTIIPPDYREIESEVLADKMPTYITSGQRADVKEAVKAIYAARSFESNDFSDEANENRIEAALAEVTNGGAIEYNDSLIEPPEFGMDDDDFEDWVDNVTPEDISKLGGWKGFDEESTADHLKDAELQSIGRGRYVVLLESGDGTFRPTMTEDGEVFILDYAQLNETQVESTPVQEQAETDQQVNSMQETLNEFGVEDSRNEPELSQDQQIDQAIAKDDAKQLSQESGGEHFIPNVSQQVSKVASKNADPEYVKAISNNPDILKKYGIDNPTRFKHFLAQMSHESAGFSARVEKRSDASAEKKYGHTTRVGKVLGNTQPGDGAKFKGRGMIQLTGRFNYQHFGDLIGVDLVNNPALAAEPKIALEVAAAFWKARGLNELADKGDLKGITKKINGGFNGLADRQARFKRLGN